MRRSALLLLAATLPTAASAAEQGAAPREAVHGYAGLALSPAGDEMASVETGASGRGAVTVRAVSDGHVLRTLDPCPSCTYSGLAYGPRGRLAFLARDRAAGTATLEIADGTRAASVATIPGLASTPRFSPDGGRIAVMVTLGASKETGATQAGARQVGEIGEHSDAQQLAVFPLGQPAVTGAAVKPISPAGRFVYEYDWTPDGRGFVATTALGNGDNNWWIATLDYVDAQTGAVRQIAKPATQANFPRISPDGRTVAYVGGLMSDFGSVGGDVWTVPLAGGTPRDVTPGYKGSVTSIAWTAGGLRGTALAGADLRLVGIDEAGGVATLWARPVSLAAGDGRAAWSRDGRIAAASAQDFEHAPALWAGPAATLRQVSHDNDAVPASVRARSVTWRNDGYTVQGWLLAPLNADPAAKAPMIVDVHGGPAAANTPNFVADRGGLGEMTRAGYYVFLPNPRGSYGQGEAFTAANRRDFGGGDLRDILTGIDAAEKVAPIDDARLGLTGGSYGGFMSMWANTQTNRFKAIVAGAGLSNWVSYYGTNGIDQWMLPFFGKTLYEDRAAYERPSAIYQIAKARTPTFIYVGERDIEVPPTQSVEYWHALHDLGVPTSLVIYPDEGHGIRQPEHAADVRQRTLAWFARYLQPGARP